MKTQIDGSDFRLMFASAAAAVGNRLQEINELNVFPVPDGDTGTNMSMTMNAGLAVLADSANIGQASHNAAQGLLRGARGNSGVILSLLFRGLAKHLKDRETADGADFAAALKEGVDAAYRSVMKPAEGTILTVSRVSAQAGVSLGSRDLGEVLDCMIQSADAALKETVNQNPVLKKAGVVDAGAYGYCLILLGMQKALRGDPEVSGEVTETKQSADFSDFDAGDITFGYCTEFIISRDPESTADPAKLQAYLGSVGDSLVFVEDEQIIKVHVHTNDPGAAISKALEYGALHPIKIDNMRHQHSEKVAKQETPFEPYGFVAVCAGEGLSSILRDVGANRIVEGGQTMNPSTQDIADAVRGVRAHTVFVLPNNKNIIMAAEQTVPLFEDRRVIVLPSKTVPQGVSALLTFDPESDADANTANMAQAMSAVATASVTYAARDSVFDGLNIKEGEFMALIEGKLLTNSPSRASVVAAIAEKLSENSPSAIVIYSGEGVSEAEAEAARKTFEAKIPRADVQTIPGGQPVYSFIISAE